MADVKLTYVPTIGEQKAIDIMLKERSQWMNGAVYVTDEYQFIMRNVVKKARRNYLGIFREQRDPITDRKKIFIPFTEWITETLLKNIDIDTKDLDVKARHGKDTDYLKAQFFRHILQKKLKDVGFNKTLNKFLRRIAIDGTGFLKAGKDEAGKLFIQNVDRMNMLYDQSVEEIDQSSGKIERHILTLPEFDQLKLKNSEAVHGLNSIQPLDFDASVVKQPTQVPYVEVYERYGWFPRMCLTDDSNDMGDYFYGHAVVSNLHSGSPVPHVIEEVEEDPYGFAKLKEVPNRADGRGIPEMLFQIQAYLNEVVNTRLNKGRIVGLGLFELKGNITPQQFKKLFATGGIKTDANSSVNVLNTGTIDPSSYRDEEQAYLWGTRVTGTTQEDEQAASRPATNALIAQQGSSKGYNLRMEDIFIDLAKFIEKKVLPIIKEELKSNKGELVRITGDEQVFADMDAILIQNAVSQKIQEAWEKTGVELTPEQEQAYIQETTQNVQKLGKDRFFPIIDELLDTEYDLYFAIDGENINKALIAQSLQQVFGMLMQTGQYPQARKVMKELFDTLGLDTESLVTDEIMPPMPMRRITETINYADLDPQSQEQMKESAGFQPAQAPNLATGGQAAINGQPSGQVTQPQGLGAPQTMPTPQVQIK